MKKLILFVCIINLIITVADASDFLELTPGSTISRKTEGKQNVGYHIYTPGSFKKGSALPLLITFSPGGRGKGMMNAFRSSAEKFGWIVVGCDRLKNGMERDEADPIEKELMSEILRKIPHSRLYLGGFSGGAMRSFTITSTGKYPVNGIFSCGGWMGGDKYHKGNFPKKMYVAWINGDKDDNANFWIEKDTQFLNKFSTEFKKFSFPGKHKVAPPAVMDKVFAWIEEPVNNAKLEELNKLYKSKKLADTYSLAMKFSIEEPAHTPQCKRAKELVDELKNKAEQQSEKLLAQNSAKISTIIAFVDDWGQDDPVTKNARDYINEKGEQKSKELLAQVPHNQKEFRKYLTIWKNYPCSQEIGEEFNTMGAEVLARMKGKKSSNKKLMAFVKYWEGFPCTDEVVKELSVSGEKELDKLLSKSKPSANLLMIFTKKWKGYPVCKKATQAILEISEKELQKIEKIEKKSSKKSKLTLFTRKYKGTPVAEKAKQMLLDLKR